MTTTSPTPPPDPAREHYPETILVVTAPGHLPFEIDLRRAPEPGLARTLAALGLAGTFAVITACNPFGQLEDDETNRERTRALAEHLARADLPAVPVAGRSPDGSHVEPGFGVKAPLEIARAIARKFRQTAIFWWDGEAVWIIEAAGEGRRGWTRLPESLDDACHHQSSSSGVPLPDRISRSP
jgi:hypothetical protein